MGIKVTVEGVAEALVDPSAAQLERVISDLALGRQFVVLDRVDAPNDEYYLQVRLSDDLGHYDIEYREGGPDSHFCAVINRDHDFTGQSVVDVIVKWAFEQDGWRDALDWQPLVANGIARCECCGEPISSTDRIDIGMVRPQPALDLPDTSVHEVNSRLLRVDDVGAFVRCLLPVSLSGGLDMVFGVWVKVSDAEFERVVDVWNEPAYAELELHGTFANMIKPWSPFIMDAPVTAAVSDSGELPYIVASDQKDLQEMLADVWDRDYVLSHFGHPLPVSVQDRIGSDEWSIERTAGMAGRLQERTYVFAGPGRSVYIDQFVATEGMSPEEILSDFLKSATEVPDDQKTTVKSGAELRHAYWQKVTVDDRERHELYGFVINGVDALVFCCIHDDPRDHAWAMHVFRSVKYWSDEVD